MDLSALVGLLNNVGLLLALGVVYQTLALEVKLNSRRQRMATGAVIGLICCAVMLNPLRLIPGVFFDARSVVLSVSGMFFGGMATLVAAVFAGALRLHQGGGGVYAGVLTIVFTSALGVAWHRLRARRRQPPSWRELYLMGLITHLVMLSCQLALPAEVRARAFATIALPVLLLFPLATALLGRLLIHHQVKHQAEIALARERDLLELVTTTSPVGITMLDADGNITYGNRRAEEILGLEASELVTRTYADPAWRILATDGQPMDPGDLPFARTKATGQPLYNMQHSIDWPDGRRMQLLINIAPLFNSTGEFSGAVSSIADVTAELATLAALHETEARLQTIIDSLPVGVYFLDPAGRLTFANPALLAMMGRSRDEVLGEGWLAAIHPEDRELALAEWVPSEATAHDAIGRFVHPDGSVVWQETRTAPVRVEGTLLGLVRIAVDITARREAAEALRASEERFRRAVEIAPLPIMIHAEDGEVLELNRIWTDLTGYSPDDLPTVSHWAQQAFGSEAAAMQQRIKELYGTSHRASNRFHSIRCADGHLRYWEFHSALLGELPDGRRTRLTMAVDVTEREHMEEARVRFQAELIKAQKMEAVGRLAGGVAHDFNNMLSVILGTVEAALAQAEPGSDLADDLGQIRLAAERSAQLTKQLLALSRRQPTAPRVLDLNAEAAETCQLLNRAVGETVELVVDGDPELWPITADPVQLDQILTNLVVNARDAIDGRGRIVVATRNVHLDAAALADQPEALTGDYVLLEVADNGSGMPPEIVAQVFEPFFTTKDEGRGTGLGLATVYSLVRGNNGFVRIESSVGQGTSFRLFFPRAESSAPAADSPQAATTETATAGGETIVVVDDEEMLLTLAARILERQGYTVLTFGNGDSALAWLDQQPAAPDLLLTDVMMPEMSGPELARAWRDRAPAARVRFMSGYAADPVTGQAPLPSEETWLRKPFTADELTRWVRAALSIEPA